jgi:hypothetical protein
VINRNERNVDNTELKLMIPKGAIVDISAVGADIDVSGLENEKLTASSVSHAGETNKSFQENE